MRPGGEDDSILAPFIRYKQDVDLTVAAVVHAMFGPTGFHPRWADSTDWHSTPQPLDSQVRSIIWSPTYSPLSLRSLPQPVPKDLPEGAESLFTFEDAFEDLLTVSQGQPLPNIYEKLGQRKLLKQVFPAGEPSHCWLRRLESQGLLRWRSETMHEPDNEPPKPRHVPDPKPHDWDTLHSELARRRAEVWDAEPRDISKRGEPPGLLDLAKVSLDLIKAHPELENRFEEMNRKMFEEIFGRRTEARRGVDPSGNEYNESDRAAPKTAEENYPKTFDEWFDQVQNFQTGGRSSWDAFKKSLDFGRELIETISKDAVDNDAHSEETKRNTRIISEHLKEQFGNIVPQERSAEGSESLYNYSTIVKDGKVYTKTECITMDNEGNEIDRSEQIHVDGIPQTSLKKDHGTTAESKSKYERGCPADDGEVKKPGWFWK